MSNHLAARHQVEERRGAATSVDEVKDIRDKARAIEMYARQAQNMEAERQAAEIRFRAERKCGELTAELVTAQGARTDLTSSGDTTKFEVVHLQDRGGSSRRTDWA